MDDYFDSCDTKEEAIERAKQVKYIHAQAGLNMRNWVNNDPTLVERLQENKKSQTLIIFKPTDNDSETRVLGMVWDPISDVFQFPSSWHKELIPYVVEGKRPTKRIALRAIMNIFDPLGVLAPTLIHGRLLMQDLW